MDAGVQKCTLVLDLQEARLMPSTRFVEPGQNALFHEKIIFTTCFLFRLFLQNYLAGHHCSELSGCDGEVTDYTPTLVIDPLTFTFETVCPTDVNECTKNACECDMEYASHLASVVADGIIANGGTALDTNNMNLPSSACVKSGLGTPVDGCCGAAPSWSLYSSATAQCVANVVVPL